MKNNISLLFLSAYRCILYICLLMSQRFRNEKTLARQKTLKSKKRFYIYGFTAHYQSESWANLNKRN